MSLSLYNIVVFCYGLVLKLASILSPKARNWVNGRKNWASRLSKQDFTQKTWVWVHCASLGEYEQAKPILDELSKIEEIRVLLSFFSPSGYELKKDTAVAGHVCYLPLDSAKNAKEFIDIVKPEVVLFVRYEFWYHYITKLKNESIPVYLISASFHKNQLFFKPIIGKWYQSVLCSFTKIFTIDRKSIQLLEDIGISNAFTIGDTRADRVLSISKEFFEFEDILRFKGDGKMIVCGSTWLEDIKVLSSCIRQFQKVKWLIAPHEIHPSQIKAQLQAIKNKDLVISHYTDGIDEKSNILILDTIGMLSKVYKYADIAFVGGGFGKGIHNVLEPAVFGIPVIFGRNFQKFPEAIGIIESKGGFAIDDSEDMNMLLRDLLLNEKLFEQASQNSKKYVQSLSGATGHILSEIEQYLNKT